MADDHRVAEPVDSPAAAGLRDAQRSHWESVLRQNPDMYGLEPSESAVTAAEAFEAAEVHRLLELGPGQGRDTLFFAESGLQVTAADYSREGLGAIELKAAASGHPIETTFVDVREPLPFPTESFDACYSHMLFCMALTTEELVNLASEIHRVLRPGGVLVYTARTLEDQHYGTGIDRGDDMYEHGGFIVHFFGPDLIGLLSKGFDRVESFRFAEGDLPRRLVSVTMRKPV